MPGFKDIFRRFTRRSGDAPTDPVVSDRTEINPRSGEFIHDPGSSVIDEVSHGDSSRAVNVPDERAVFPDRISQLQPSVEPAAADPQILNNAGALATNATELPPQPPPMPSPPPETGPVFTAAGARNLPSAAAGADHGVYAGSSQTAVLDVADDDVLFHDHLLLECPYCGQPDQRVGARCERCTGVIVRLPTWAQRRRRNWIARRLSLRRIILASIVALFIVFVVWVNYPFAPNPVVFFKNTQSKLTIDSGPGSWSVVGRDLRHSRYVEVGPPPPAGNIKWDSFVIEPLNAEPVAQRSNIYLSSANGVYPLAADTGNIREGWEGDTAGRITGAPVVYESYLYFGSTDHTINGWNAFNGDPLWSFTAEDTVEVAPVLSQGLVYVSSGEGWVYALDAVNGALIWSKQLDSNASAAVTVHEGKLLVGDDKGILYILSARTGQEWFRYRTPRAVTGSPVVSSDGERAYFAAGGELYAINARNREIPGLYQFKQVWAQLWLWQVPGVPRPQGQQGGLWRFTPENPLLGIKSSPALADTTRTGQQLAQQGTPEPELYVGGHDHNMYAINPVDGNLNWTFTAADAIWASPVVVKDRLLFGDDSGNLYSLDRSTGVLDWKLPLGDSIKIPPTIIGDLLIVRTANGSVYAIE